MIELATLSDGPVITARATPGGSGDRHGASAGSDAVRWIVRTLVAAVTLLTFATVIGHAIRGTLGEPYTALSVAANGLVALAYLAVGLLLVERRRGGPIGALLVVAGVVIAIDGPLDLYLSAVFLDVPGDGLAGGDLAALWFLASAYPISTAVVTAMLLFPDGRLLSPRWRWAVVLGVAAAITGVVAYALRSGDLGPIYTMFSSPFAVPAVPGRQLEALTSLALQAFRILAVASLIVRWRRGDHVVRAQTTWVLAAIALQAIATLAVFLTRDTWDWTFAWLSLANTAVALCLPLAMGIAIVRFRLFEIDRLVSRTIAYGVISVVLATFYVGASLGIAAILGSEGEREAISVAGATLLAATAFSTLRGRIQRTVDRRFDRARYDGARAVDGLVERLRGDVELDRVRDDVLVTVDQTVHPAQRAIWLRPGRRAGPV